jgi:hypothetical protein
MPPSLQAMNDWGEGHIDHLNKLHGEDSMTELPERSQTKYKVPSPPILRPSSTA